MGKSHRKLFISAVVSGMVLALGLPGLADVISLAWDTARTPLEKILPVGLLGIVSIVSLVLFCVICYLNWQIYLKGAKKGKRGLMMVFSGILLGILAGVCIIGFIRGFLV
jgi:hypothetical protein